MANVQNLIKPTRDRTAEQRRESASKAGKASAAKKRERKTMQEFAKEVLSLPLRSDELDSVASLSDFQRVIDMDGQRVKMPANLTVAHAALLVQAKKAMGGDARALQFLRDTAGEQPVERVEVSGDVAAAAADIGAMVARLKEGDG